MLIAHLSIPICARAIGYTKGSSLRCERQQGRLIIVADAGTQKGRRAVAGTGGEPEWATKIFISVH